MPWFYYVYDLFSHNITFAIFFDYIACTIKVLKYERIGGKSNFKKFIFIIFFSLYMLLLIVNFESYYHIPSYVILKYEWMGGEKLKNPLPYLS